MFRITPANAGKSLERSRFPYQSNYNTKLDYNIMRIERLSVLAYKMLVHSFISSSASPTVIGSK